MYVRSDLGSRTPERMQRSLASLRDLGLQDRELREQLENTALQRALLVEDLARLSGTGTGPSDPLGAPVPGPATEPTAPPPQQDPQYPRLVEEWLRTVPQRLRQVRRLYVVKQATEGKQPGVYSTYTEYTAAVRDHQVTWSGRGNIPYARGTESKGFSGPFRLPDALAWWAETFDQPPIYH